jgi:nucleoside 2-deoxyribosyltransferase
MKLYLAAPMYTQAERSWNQQLAASLSAAGHDVFLPQEAIRTHGAMDADAVFRLCVDAISPVDAVISVTDGPDADSATSFKCGLAYALGKPIIAVRTDFRSGSSPLPKQKLAAVNVFLSQASKTVIHDPNATGNAEQIASKNLQAIGTTSPSSRGPEPTSSKQTGGFV